MKNEGPNDFYIGRTFLFRHTGVQKKNRPQEIARESFARRVQSRVKKLN